jgi:hypothetical protein
MQVDTIYSHFARGYRCAGRKNNPERNSLSMPNLQVEHGRLPLHASQLQCPSSFHIVVIYTSAF